MARKTGNAHPQRVEPGGERLGNCAVLLVGDYEAFATGARDVIGTKSELAASLAATRTTASNRSMKISASMAVSPK